MQNSYGLFCYNSINIGDEIQSLAAKRFLPKVDYLINREQLSQFSCPVPAQKVKLIMNAWYCWRPNFFLPQNCIDPLLISMCWSKRVQNKKSFQPNIANYLRTHGPVGCRDMDTFAFMKANQIPAYFSGCLTTTLLGSRVSGQGYALCVDTSPKVINYVRKKSKFPVYELSKQIGPYINSKDRLQIAKAFLFLLQNAEFVITSNLHSALPSIAFGTPTCLIIPEDKETKEDLHNRIQGFDGVFNSCTEIEFLNQEPYDVSNPPKNPEGYKKMRDALVTKCSSFTGFDSNKSLFEEGYNPLIDLIKSINDDYAKTKRTLYFAGCKDLLKVVFAKKIQRKTQFDLLE